MTETQEKALALVNEVREGRPYTIDEAKREYGWCFQAVCRAIEQHEAFRQEVSNAVEDLLSGAVFRKAAHDRLSRFIITKPDPLVDVCEEMGLGRSVSAADELTAAIAKRGGKIVWEDK